MKRILFVLAIMLVLTVCFVGEAFALNRPWVISNNGPTGDDHPWGGEDYSDDPPPISTKYGSQVSYTTGIVAVDFIFKYFIFENAIYIEHNYPEKRTRHAERLDTYKYSSSKNEGIRK